jgi:hypothetical protein
MSIIAPVLAGTPTVICIPYSDYKPSLHYFSLIKLSSLANMRRKVFVSSVCGLRQIRMYLRYEGTSKMLRTGSAIYTAVLVAPVNGRTTVSSESMCQVARSWVNGGNFLSCLFDVVYFAIASVREFLDTPSYSLSFIFYFYALLVFTLLTDICLGYRFI